MWRFVGVVVGEGGYFVLVFGVGVWWGGCFCCVVGDGGYWVCVGDFWRRMFRLRWRFCNFCWRRRRRFFCFMFLRLLLRWRKGVFSRVFFLYFFPIGFLVNII
jgi:hypothetical protein